ncbi:hypothetical protein AVEN_71444-1 [Araneus ventricosus]|uniref:Uncharacterized protein n=1 Tax=Araneus ventricosus TaxID=182803 RepID=A0A4Y2CVY0_ARAVE|nr:hypothetical protein AVEN_71444-1 [Araneus ventricosus]
MDRLPALSDTKVSSKWIGTRLAKFRFKGEWIGYWLYQIQKYQVNVSGTNEYQYQHVSDTAKTCINPSLLCLFSSEGHGLQFLSLTVIFHLCAA